MGVYIPNMEKPKSCYNHCLEGFIANEEIGCPLNDYIESHQFKHSIHPNCPLIEIVRCGECEYGTKVITTGKITCKLDRQVWEKTDFCSYGERRTDEHNT